LAKGHSNFYCWMKKKFSFAIIFFIAGIIIAIVISVRAVQEAYRSRTIEKEVEGLKQQAQSIQNENSTIQKQLDYYSTAQFVEKVSKDRMNLQKPDENVVIVNQGNAVQAPAAENTDAVPQADQDAPNYAKWWDIFFKYD
jgi:uncharacterized membrane-anchored protein YhcB (DUF1043 family)